MKRPVPQTINATEAHAVAESAAGPGAGAPVTLSKVSKRNRKRLINISGKLLSVYRRRAVAMDDVDEDDVAEVREIMRHMRDVARATETDVGAMKAGFAYQRELARVQLLSDDLSAAEYHTILTRISESEARIMKLEQAGATAVAGVIIQIGDLGEPSEDTGPGKALVIR